MLVPNCVLNGKWYETLHFNRLLGYQHPFFTEQGGEKAPSTLFEL